MKKNYTHISVLLDRSGSMETIKNDVIGGFNEFLKEQQSVEGECTMSLIQFDNEETKVNEFTNIKEIVPLNTETFRPRGGTALLKYATKLINDTGETLANLKESDRPEKVLFVMITDGEENASNDGGGSFLNRTFDFNKKVVQYTNEKLKELTTHQRNNYNWEFIYIGANQDAFSVGHSLGARGVNYSADTIGTNKMFKAMSKSTTSYRSASDANFSLTQNDIDNA